MLSSNEWDDLKHVIVGRADQARIPPLDLSLRTINYGHLHDLGRVPEGLYPQQVIDEANEDLQGMVDFLESLGVRVSRPDMATPPDYYYFCPRDSVCVFSDMIVESPMPLRARRHESRAYYHVFRDLSQDFSWVTLSAERADDLYNLACVQDPDVLALTEYEACFDAANVIRANDDIFYLVSNSGNRRGAELLQELVGARRRVWPIQDVYAYMHIDSTICLLREGLMLLNPERIRHLDQLPEPLRSWDVIWAPDPGDLWHFPGYCNAGRWVSMNIFSVNPSLVLVEQQQTGLARLLEKHGISCQLLPMRHARTLGGSFHCCTLDMERACQ